MSDLIHSNNPFSSVELATMRRVAGLMIPASAEYSMPSADDDAIFGMIVARAGEAAAVIKTGLGVLDNLARERQSMAYVDLNDADAGQLVEDLQGARESFMRLLMSTIVQCYYQDDRVMVALDMEPRPPFPEGYEVEQGDWSLLDPVKARDKFYRTV